ncbi:MAG TPA: hypothetical protein VK140_14915 [Ktedonobacteraceae bacterium]|nr:hypothetical protein [Ktedonobacteraceae bacterium]
MLKTLAFSHLHALVVEYGIYRVSQGRDKSGPYILERETEAYLVVLL